MYKKREFKHKLCTLSKACQIKCTEKCENITLKKINQPAVKLFIKMCVVSFVMVFSMKI